MYDGFGLVPICMLSTLLFECILSIGSMPYVIGVIKQRGNVLSWDSNTPLPEVLTLPDSAVSLLSGHTIGTSWELNYYRRALPLWEY